MKQLFIMLGVLCGLIFGARETSGNDPLSSAPSSIASPTVPASPEVASLLGSGTDLEGYVTDGECASCHREIAESYAQVAMANSFYEPRTETSIEDFGRFEHRESHSFFEMEIEEGYYVFRRYQLGVDNERINEYERVVDWIVGSGNHSRVYLYSNPAGELYQLPIAWYSQSRQWGMAPGYDRSDHSGVQRQVKRECMFCHNAYPLESSSGDAYWQPHLFPPELPQGIGCQRCHGPGGAHIWMVRNPQYVTEDMAIVNPSKLALERQRDLCYQCHMQPSVALVGVRAFGQGVYSFRPGDVLAEYQPTLDVVEEGKAKDERFEINHHPYRLEQSLCFRRSSGALSCLSCHDPHVKVQPAEQGAFYAAKCLGCHQDVESLAFAHGGDLPNECTSCHMPARTPSDVIHVTMTDHRIQRTDSWTDYRVPVKEIDPVLIDATYLYPELAPLDSLADVYRTSAVIRAGGRHASSAVRRLEGLIAEGNRLPLEPRLDLARGQLLVHDLAALEKTTLGILEDFPDFPRALEWLAIVRDAEQNHQQSIDLLSRAIELDPARVETLFNLGLVRARAGLTEEAIHTLEEVVERRPEFAAAWFHLGRLEAERGSVKAAETRFKRALEIDPRHSRASEGLARSLMRSGQIDRAERVLLHAGRVAKDRDMIFELLRGIGESRQTGGE